MTIRQQMELDRIREQLACRPQQPISQADSERKRSLEVLERREWEDQKESTQWFHPLNN